MFFPFFGPRRTAAKAFIRKWRLKHRAVADSLEEAGERSFRVLAGNLVGRRGPLPGARRHIVLRLSPTRISARAGTKRGKRVSHITSNCLAGAPKGHQNPGPVQVIWRNPDGHLW